MKRSVYIFGWATIVVSVVLAFSQLLNLAITNSMDQIAGLFGGYPGLRNGILSSLKDLFEYNRIWSIYSILYFLVTLFGGIQFVRLKEIGRRVLEIASWVGIVNACIDTTVSYLFWNDMEAAMRMTEGSIGLSLQQLNPLGFGAIVVGFFVWVIPSIGIIVYLRRPSLKSLMNHGSATFTGEDSVKSKVGTTPQKK